MKYKIMILSLFLRWHSLLQNMSKKSYYSICKNIHWLILLHNYYYHYIRWKVACWFDPETYFRYYLRFCKSRILLIFYQRFPLMKQCGFSLIKATVTSLKMGFKTIKLFCLFHRLGKNKLYVRCPYITYYLVKCFLLIMFDTWYYQEAVKYGWIYTGENEFDAKCPNGIVIVRNCALLD